MAHHLFPRARPLRAARSHLHGKRGAAFPEIAGKPGFALSPREIAAGGVAGAGHRGADEVWESPTRV
jgi:hypothetical protein